MLAMLPGPNRVRAESLQDPRQGEVLAKPGVVERTGWLQDLSTDVRFRDLGTMEQRNAMSHGPSPIEY